MKPSPKYARLDLDREEAALLMYALANWAARNNDLSQMAQRRLKPEAMAVYAATAAAARELRERLVAFSKEQGWI